MVILGCGHTWAGIQGFLQVLRTWGGTLQNLIRGLESTHGGAWGGGLKTLLKKTSEGVHLLVKLPAISLEA